MTDALSAAIESILRTDDLSEEIHQAQINTLRDAYDAAKKDIPRREWRGLSEGLGRLTPERAEWVRAWFAERYADSGVFDDGPEALTLEAACQLVADAQAAERERFNALLDDYRGVLESLTHEQAELADALHAMRAYARENPRHEYQGVTQDPNGVHAWLARNERPNVNSPPTPLPHPDANHVEQR
jgi:hypothetical protein